jgi:Protein of unknown function (DUF732)
MFAKHRLTKFAGAAIVAGALGLAAVATAGTAGAISSADDTFLTEISTEGIAYDSEREVISVAHDVCFALEEGADPVGLGMELLQNTDLSTDQAAVFVLASVGNYCPEYGVAIRIDPSIRGGPAAAAGPPHPQPENDHHDHFTPRPHRPYACTAAHLGGHCAPPPQCWRAAR